MRFSLKQPCPKCPFRKDVPPYLTAERVESIVAEVVEGGRTFTCHEHIHGAADEQSEEYQPSSRDQMCAGVMAMVERAGIPHQMLQIAERLGLRDPDRLDPSSLDMVYESPAAMVEAYRDARC